MDVRLLYFEDPPDWKLLDEPSSRSRPERAHPGVSRHLVDTVEDAERFGFDGSPVTTP